MKLLQTKLSSPYNSFSLPSDTALFDIETTGLSADTSYLYLIGAIHKSGDDTVLTQWFCDEYSEEKDILQSFLTFLENYSRLVHYNGTGFDIPYLNKKIKRHHLRGYISAENSTDLYKLLLPYKKHTAFPDFKQKTLEASAGFERKDTFTGGDLIDVYAAYAGKSRLATLTGNTEEADALRHVLLLHNHDDLLGLFHLYHKTRLPAFFNGELSPSVLKIPEGLLYSFDTPFLPFPLEIRNQENSLVITKETTDFFFPLYEGELKYFFKDYKNYSYLKYEDTAVHNAVAEWVNKEAKEKCRPATAYQKKTGVFLPLPFKKPEQEELLEGLNLFYQDYKVLPVYAEYSEELICNPDFVRACICALLK